MSSRNHRFCFLFALSFFVAAAARPAHAKVYGVVLTGGAVASFVLAAVGTDSYREDNGGGLVAVVMGGALGLGCLAWSESLAAGGHPAWSVVLAADQSESIDSVRNEFGLEASDAKELVSQIQVRISKARITHPDQAVLEVGFTEAELRQMFATSDLKEEKLQELIQKLE